MLYDDRGERPGVMFNDADLIGLPVRLTVSARSLEAGGVETKLRTEQEKNTIARGDVVAWVGERLGAMRSALEQKAEQAVSST